MDRTKGATRAQWLHFADTLALVPALVPVVADVHATIASSSKLRPEQLGKIPSRYNGSGLVAGFGKWTQLSPSESDVGAWSRHGGYSIGVQGRSDGLSAIDVDIADGQAAADVRAFLEGWWMAPLPVRWRQNAHKFLIPFRASASVSKRIIKTKAGNLEILGDGQHWVACGTHPSGVLYQWDYAGEAALPTLATIPTLTIADVDELTEALTMRFGTEQAIRIKASKSKAMVAARIVTADPVAKYLSEEGWVTATRADGAMDIRCPFEDGHSTGVTGDTSTIYYPAHTGGYVLGHFKCLHGSCGARTDNDFLNACGYTVSQFGELINEEQGDEEIKALGDQMAEFLALNLPRNKSYKLIPSLDALSAVLSRPLMTGTDIRFDAFKTLPIVTKASDGPRPMADADPIILCRTLERKPFNFAAIPENNMRRALLAHFHENKFDSGHAWLAGLPAWDGVPRVERFAATYLASEDTPYTRAASRYLWTSMVARTAADEHGVKVDMILVLIGTQGAGKSTAVKMIAPVPAQHTELDLALPEIERSRLIQGMTVIEIPEMIGFAKREQIELKAWVTKTHDKWTPKYIEQAITVARRGIFIGTSNEKEFLTDTTGERRWLPVMVGANINTDGIARDRLQLWAEAFDLFTLFGIDFKEAEQRAREVHSKHKVTDIWDDAISAYLAGGDIAMNTDEGAVAATTPAEVLMGALGKSVGQLTRSDEMRVAKVLSRLGFVRDAEKSTRAGVRVRLWRKV